MTEGIVKGYWKEYYDFWDDFVGDWFKEQENEPGAINKYKNIYKAYENAVAHLELEELPTPYLGKPHAGVDAVILNMNPGLSEIIGFGKFAGKNSDWTQFYSHINDEIGWLICKFKDKANGLYSSFVGIGSDINYSCLNPDLLDTSKYPDWVCGVNWWQGYDKKLIEKKYRKKCCQNRDKRMPWLRQIYNKDISPAKVFALELCPFHSKEFSFKQADKDLLKFIPDHVIIPAATAVVENGLPFAVAVGKTTADVLEKGMGILPKKEWSCETQPKDWPTNDGRKRKYRLYDVKVQNDRIAHFVVTWVNRGIPSPEQRFADFEKRIHDYCCPNGNTVGEHNCDRMTNRLEDALKRAEPQQPKTASVPNQDRTQLYGNLWSGFSEWCKDNKKAWFTKEVNCDANYIEPADKGKSFCLLFNVRGIAPLKGKLCLGIRCDTLSIWGEIKKTCKKGFEDINADMWWGDEQSSTSRTILFPFAEDWRNPNEALFNKMANTFESVRDVLRDKGFL